MNDEGIPSYSFSKITDKKLSELVDIKQSIDSNIFDDWFAFEVDFSDELISFLTSLIDKNRFLIKKYNKLSHLYHQAPQKAPTQRKESKKFV